MSLEQSLDIAGKVVSLAEDGLRRIEVQIAGWPGEFRAIIWDAVADIAARRAAAAKNEP